jgi:putative PIN family toxin of toxin-antitoxin system
VYGDKLHVVLDTNVVFEGLTKKDGASGLIIEAWFAAYIEVFVSNALLYEYVDVLSRKLSPARWAMAQTALRTLIAKAEFQTIYYSWRPSTPDPGDEFVVDCVMNANALLITHNRKDFRLAEMDLGIYVLSPNQFVELMAKL